jgi:hypothetical protein
VLFALQAALAEDDEWRAASDVVFCLFAAAHPLSKVWLAAYQATGSFFLELTPFKSRQL